MNNPSSKQAEKLAQIETQEITQMLQSGRTLGTNKLLINVNGQSSKIQSNKNGIIRYTMEQPVKLNIGDQVTLIDSFVEERGLAQDTIEIEEDIEEEMRFLYYTQGDLRNTQTIAGDAPYAGYCADMEFAHFPSFFPDCNIASNPSQQTPQLDFRETANTSFLLMPNNCAPMFPTWNYRTEAMGPGYEMVKATTANIAAGLTQPTIKNIGKSNLGLSASNGSIFNCSTGATGQYYYMMEFFSPSKPGDATDPRYSWPSSPEDIRTKGTAFLLADRSFMRPLYGATTIKVPAGNYSVSALSDLINNQLNGSIANATDTGRTLLTERLYERTNEKSFEVTVPPFSGLFSSTVDVNTQDKALYNPDVSVIGADTFQAFQRRRGDVVTQFYFNSDITGNRVNLQTMRYTQTFGLTANIYAKYANGQYMDRYNSQPLNPDPALEENDDQNWHLGSTCGDLQSLKDPIYASKYNDLRQFNSNFYMHLKGFRFLFENDDSQYYNQPPDTDTDIDEYYNPRNFPCLADLFRCNVGYTGLKYYEQNPTLWNEGGYDITGVDPADFPWTYGTKPSEYIFSCMFGVSGAADSNIPVWEATIASPGGNTSNGIPEDIDILPNPKPIVQQFAGTTAIEVSFDLGKTNRFQLSNLHEPYKLQNVTSTGSGPTNMGGQEATSFNYTSFFSKGEGGAQFFEINGPVNAPCGIYPIEAVGGIAVNNFSFSTVKNTKIYKDLVAKIAQYNIDNKSRQMYREKLIYDLFTKPYDEFFSSDDEAKAAWSKTIWQRIGFDYDQVGKISDKLESVFSFSNPTGVDPSVQDVEKVNIVKQKGLITHNAYDNSFIPSSGGLGIANPYSGQVTSAGNPQGYGLRSAGIGANTLKTANQGFAQNRINILSNTQPLTADSFPALNNGNNYLIIESDIVKPNAKDAKSNQTTIVGIISKENANNDTLFHNTPIPFTITEPKLLSTIEVRIRNPDGTLVSDDIVGKNNGFIFQIEKAIEPGAMTMASF